MSGLSAVQALALMDRSKQLSLDEQLSLFARLKFTIEKDGSGESMLSHLRDRAETSREVRQDIDTFLSMRRPALELNHDGWVYSVAFSPDGTTLASGGGDDRTVRLWEAATGRKIRTLSGHTGWV